MQILPPLEQKSELHHNGKPVEPASSGKYQYFILARPRLTRRWEAIACFNAAGDGCWAAARTHAEAYGFEFSNRAKTKLVDGREWARQQQSYQAADNRK